MNYLEKLQTSSLISQDVAREATRELELQAIQRPEIEKAVLRLQAFRALNAAESRIFLNEVQTPRMNWLSEDGYHNTTIDILTEIAFISNAPLYPDGPEQLAQLEVLKQFLITSPRFSQMHAGDIVHAFYMNEDGGHWDHVKHFSKFLSCEYVGAVLNPFLRFKQRMEPKRKMLLKSLPQQFLTAIPFYGPVYWEGEINTDLMLMNAGNPGKIFNIETKYKYLRKSNIIRIRSMAHWYRWVGYTIGQLKERESRKPTKTEAQTLEKQKLVAMYGEMIQTNSIPRHEIPRIIFQTRREIYLQHLKRAADQGITDLFNRSQHAER